MVATETRNSSPRQHRAPLPLLATLQIFIVMMSCTAAMAQQRVALIIGNGSYQHEAALRNPVNDARLIERTLQEKYLRFDSIARIENANRIDLLQALARFRKQAQGAELALIYYSGHGMINSRRQNYVIPVEMPRLAADASIDIDAALKSYGVSEDEIIDSIEGAKVQIVIMDACRDNGFTNASRGGVKGLSRRVDQTRNRLLAYATEEGRTAEDGKGSNSTYAVSLAKNIVRIEWPILKVFDEIARDVENSTANQQLPTRSGNLRTDVFLVNDKSNILFEPRQPDPEAEAWRIADGSAQLQSYQAFIEKFPSSKYTALAEVKIAAMKAASEKPAVASGGRRVTKPENIGSRKTPCDQCPVLIYVPGGRFVMGSPATEGKRSMTEGPQHSVNIDPIWVGIYEVTADEWNKCASDGACPRRSVDPAGARLPVVNVNWDDAQKYTGWLSKRSSLICRLPSEAEWEYVARSGADSIFSTGERIESSQANFDSSFTYNGSEKVIRKLGIIPVGSFPPNTFGVHDMHGNVREWVQDIWHKDYIGAPGDSSPWIDFGDPSRRVVRGGGWDSYPQFLRSAGRDFSPAAGGSFSLGFRIICE